MASIMNMLGRAKAWMAIINEESWHFRLVKYAEVSVSDHACIYRWLCVPWAMIKMGVIYLVIGIWSAFGWFFGFTADFRKESSELMYSYKTKKNGERKLVTPWEVTVGALVLWLLSEVVRFAMANTQIFLTGLVYVFAGVGVLESLFLVGYLLRHRVMELLGQICPPLVVVKKTQQ